MATVAYTYGQGFFTLALLLWIFVWLYVAVGIIRRHDLGFGAKVLWIVFILVVPLLGLFIYFLWNASRPGPA